MVTCQFNDNLRFRTLQCPISSVGKDPPINPQVYQSRVGRRVRICPRMYLHMFAAWFGIVMANVREWLWGLGSYPAGFYYRTGPSWFLFALSLQPDKGVYFV